jgi:DNA polymerase II small subunit/DNA polymerase delta subunit B
MTNIWNKNNLKHIKEIMSKYKTIEEAAEALSAFFGLDVTKNSLMNMISSYYGIKAKTLLKNGKKQIKWTDEKISEIKKILNSSNTVESAVIKISNKFNEKVTTNMIRKLFNRKGFSSPGTYLGEIPPNSTLIEISDKRQKNDMIDLLMNLMKKRSKKKGAMPFREICDKLDLSPKRAEKLIEEAKDVGCRLSIGEDAVLLDRSEKVSNVSTDIVLPKTDGKNKLRLCVISDTHIGSLAASSESIQHFVNLCYDEYGIRTVIHGGDWLAGNNVYRGQQAELSIWGCLNQCKEAAKVFPQREGLTYYGVLGNHDMNFVKNAGGAPDELLEKFRPDINIIGHIKGIINFKEFGISAEVIHVKSSAHARSYALEKHLARSMSKGNQPDLVLAGHRHTNGYFQINDVHAFMLPTFEDANIFVLYNDFIPSMGGLILEITFDDDNQIQEVAPVFKKYYPKPLPIETI